MFAQLNLCNVPCSGCLPNEEQLFIYLTGNPIAHPLKHINTINPK